MTDPSDQEPRIIVDSDWKSQAQAEKERLAKQEEAAADDPQHGPHGLPPADFQGLVEMLAAQALMYLGGVADRQTGQAVFDPVFSRHMIDLLGVLHDKTKGNLAAEESAMLTQLLAELRSRYVELAQMIASQQAKAASRQPPDLKA